jgi:hypothetical protein
MHGHIYPFITSVMVIHSFIKMQEQVDWALIWIYVIFILRIKLLYNIALISP